MAACWGLHSHLTQYKTLQISITSKLEQVFPTHSCLILLYYDCKPFLNIYIYIFLNISFCLVGMCVYQFPNYLVHFCACILSIWEVRKINESNHYLKVLCFKAIDIKKRFIYIYKKNYISSQPLCLWFKCNDLFTIRVMVVVQDSQLYN